MPTWPLSAFADEAGPSTDEQLQALADAGIRHIDPRSVDGHNITELPLDLAKTVAQRYADAGIAVGMFGSPIGKTDITDDLNEELARLEHLAALKDVFACDRVRVFSFFNKTGAAPDDWRDQSIDRLKQLIDAADKLGLVLYHENETDIFGDHPDDVLEVAELRGERFKLIYDFANYLRTGADPVDTWEEMCDITDAFHFKDQVEHGEHMPMGQGDTAARAILTDAVKSGWEGPITLEPHLTHSAAVVATGVRGNPDTTLADLPPAETFQLAANATLHLLQTLGVDPDLQPAGDADGSDTNDTDAATVPPDAG